TKNCCQEHSGGSDNTQTHVQVKALVRYSGTARMTIKVRCCSCILGKWTLLVVDGASGELATTAFRLLAGDVDGFRVHVQWWDARLPPSLELWLLGLTRRPGTASVICRDRQVLLSFEDDGSVDGPLKSLRVDAEIGDSNQQVLKN